MSLIKILRKNKEINDRRETISPTSASISIDDNSINFSINGVPACVDIQYSGAVFFTKNMSILLKSFVDKNKILITNIFRQEFPELLYKYEGNLKIISCKIMTYDGFIFSATINNNLQAVLLESQDTKPEDDTILLYEEFKEDKRMIRRGQSKPTIKPSALNKEGKISIIPPRDIDFVATTIYRGARAMSTARKGLPSVSRPSKQTTQTVKQPPKVSKEPPKKTQAKGKY